MIETLSTITNEKKGIRVNHGARYFEFYVAGYSKSVQDKPVQPNHVLLYSDVMHLHNGRDANSVLFPFGKDDPLTFTYLVKEPNNPYDKYALLVYAYHPLNIIEYAGGLAHPRQRLPLGYVPKSISRIVSHNFNRIQNGWIKKCRSNHGGKSFTTKVAFPWKLDVFKEDLVFLDRLADALSSNE